MTIKNRWKKNRGFTLLEVMLSMAILGITLVAVFQLQAQSIAMSGNARFLTIAPLLAQSKMAELESADSEDLISASGIFGEQFPEYSWKVAVTDTEINHVKRIDVTIANNIMRRNNTCQITLYRYVRQ